MFDVYELTTLRKLLVRDLGAEWVKREQDGLSKETIKAQLHGMMQILIKLNMELMKRYEQDQSSPVR